MTIDEYMDANSIVEKFTDYCKKHNLNIITDKCRFYNGLSIQYYRVSNTNGDFYHDINTLEDMKSFYNAFSLGREYNKLNGDKHE
jgi:hypothetical protein